MMSGNFTAESQMSSCDEPRGIGCWNLWGFMACTQAPRQNKQNNNAGIQALTREREKVLIAREFLESLAKLPSHYCRKDSLKLPWNCDYFTHTSDQSVSRILRFQRKSPSVQTSFTRGNEDAKHCHIQPPKKISAICVLDIKMALSPNRTSGIIKREKKSQNRKWIMINRRPKETKTSWFSPWTFRRSCRLHVYLQMQIITKPSFTVMTLQSTSCLTVMSCVTSGMRWTVNWRTATRHTSDMVHGCMVYTELAPRWLQFHVAPAMPAL